MGQVFRGLSVVAVVLITAFVSRAQSPPDPDQFLRFFNDVSPAFAESETTARAYYRAIDPTAAKTTLDAFKERNGFSGAQDVAKAVYLNDADLGFGRVMYVWTAGDGSIASFVENYGDDNFDFAAGDTVVQAIDGPPEEILANAIQGSQTDELPKEGLLATVAMEYGPPPGDPTGQKYTRFYIYGGDGNRLTKIDLDGRGEKFLPGTCNVCHGGNARPLGDDSSYPFHGDTQAGFISWDLETYLYSSSPGFQRADQEPAFRALNEFVLKTAPTAGGKELIEGWYADVNPADESLPANLFDPSFVPPGWAGQEGLYLEGFAPSCRACHATRTNPVQQMRGHSDFVELSGRIDNLVFERGVMPLAKRSYDRFWSSTAPGSNAAVLAEAVGRNAASDRPGDDPPVPFAGVDSFAPVGLPLPLDASQTLFGSEPGVSFNWTIFEQPAGSAVLVADPAAAETLFTPTQVGLYDFDLGAVNGAGSGGSTGVAIETTPTGVASEANAFVAFDNTGVPAAAVGGAVANCLGCHGGPSFGAPSFLDARAGETPTQALFRNLSMRSNVQQPEQSLLLLKSTQAIPHGGGRQITEAGPEYASLLAWIRQGARAVHRPVNDDVVDALTLPTPTGSATASNLKATRETGADAAGNSIEEASNGGSVWWQWPGFGVGDLSIDTTGSDAGIGPLRVYTGGGDVANLTLLAEDAPGIAVPSQVTLTTNGEPLMISVDGYRDAVAGALEGTIVLNWSFVEAEVEEEEVKRRHRRRDKSRHRDGRRSHRDGRHHDGRHADERHDDGRHAGDRHHGRRHADDRHRDGRHHNGRH